MSFHIFTFLLIGVTRTAGARLNSCYTQVIPSRVIHVCLRGDNVSAFSYMERQTNNSGLMAKLDMERQAKSRKRPGLGIKDKETKMHITQKLLVGFFPNLHQQTRRVYVHLFVYYVKVIRIPL